MWKDYSLSYMKNNRALGVPVMVAALISALLLSLLCSLFYNVWIYEIERIEESEGGWQGRLVGDIDTQGLGAILNYANVETAVVNEDMSNGQGVTVDIYLKNMRTILTDMPQIAKLAGLTQEAVSYNHILLNMYLIRDPQDTAPRLIFPLILGVTLIACFSLVMIIHNSFAVSMHARIHQFGILSSIGATPAQIRACLLQEAAALCAVPVVAGSLLGIGISVWVCGWTNAWLADAVERHEIVWKYDPLVFVSTLAITALTILASAWLPAVKMSRMTPLEAIKNTGELYLKRRKRSFFLPLLFGVEGELAGNALKAQRKALRTTTLSLVFSFLAFTLMQCFFTLTGISQRETYFAKYQEAWDVMVTVKDTGVEEIGETGRIQELSGIRSGTAYQRASARRIVTREEISEELAALGGFSHAPEAYVTETEDGWLVNAPIIILDDASFLAYCEQIGAKPRLDGAVIRNRIEDPSDSDFRNRDEVDYLTGLRETSLLRQAGGEELTAEIPVLAYTWEVPALREEYGTLDLYELVHFIPLSLWGRIGEVIGGVEEDSYIRALAEEDVTLEELNALQEELGTILGAKYETVIENRIQDKLSNDKMLQGMMMILGGFCVLLALIGIGNVFSVTLGFVRQRKREYARYISVGLTPEGLKKLFCIEALVLAGRPVVVTLPLTVIMVACMLRLSYLEPMVFIREAPVLPILIFLMVMVGFVALAYYLGWRKVARVSLTEALRDDTMI